MSKLSSPVARRLLWGSVGLLGVVALVLVVVVAWQQVQRQSLSDEIFPAPGEGENLSFGVRKGLRDAKVVVPNRPHNLEEVPTLDLRVDFARKREFRISTNSLGLRSPDPSDGLPMEIESPAKGFRIVCLGASITFGWGVSNAESYPARLAQELGVEVINAGAPAGDVILLAEWAEKNILQLDPDLILFNVRPAYRDPQGPAQVLVQGVDILKRAAPQARIGVVMPPLSTFDLQTPDILMDYPQMGWGGEGDGQPAAEADARATAQALAPIPLLDLTPAFRDAQFRYQPRGDGVAVLLQRSRSHQRLVRIPSRTLLVEVPAARDGIAKQILGAFDADATLHEPLFYDGGHPDADGYALYAREVARWVRQQGWLSGP
jgi:hypothetical protein